MNIFYLSPDPAECATFHNNKHVVKMITEYTQIICTVFHKIENYDTEVMAVREFYLQAKSAYGLTIPYKPTHENHPCVLWAGKALQNLIYLLDLHKYLINEYHYRYPGNPDNFKKATHLSIQLHGPIFDLKRSSTLGPIENVACAFGENPEQYWVQDENGKIDPVQSYRQYYIKDKANMANWSPRSRPQWYPSSSLA